MSQQVLIWLLYVFNNYIHIYTKCITNSEYYLLYLYYYQHNKRYSRFVCYSFVSYLLHSIIMKFCTTYIGINNTTHNKNKGTIRHRSKTPSKILTNKLIIACKLITRYPNQVLNKDFLNSNSHLYQQKYIISTN